VAGLQRFVGAVWTDVIANSPYAVPISGSYRVRYQKSNCPDIFSNTVVVTIAAPPTISYLSSCPDANYTGQIIDIPPCNYGVIVIDLNCNCSPTLHTWTFSYTSSLPITWSITNLGAEYNAYIVSSTSNTITIGFTLGTPGTYCNMPVINSFFNLIGTTCHGATVFQIAAIEC
jgi:hypothetical protein